MVNLNKKGISPVIATILLLAITVIIAVGVYQFLNTYTQDTFDNISGDSTVSLAFGNKVSMYDSDNLGNLTVFFAETSYTEDLNFSEFIFSGPGDSITCTQTGGYQIPAGQSEEFIFERAGTSGNCSGTFTEGKYELLMLGEIPVEVSGINYRR